MIFCLKFDLVAKYHIFNENFQSAACFVLFCFLYYYLVFSVRGQQCDWSERPPNPAAETWSLVRLRIERSLHIKTTPRGLYFEKANRRRFRSSRVCFTRLHATGAHLSTRRAARERQLSDTGWRGADAPLFTGPLTFLLKPPSSWHSSPATAPDTGRNKWRTIVS